jgi:nucleoside-diphosphate-sugar epimerase
VSSLAAREPTLSDYAASKRAGEEAVETIARGSATVVRPPAIYGQGDRETLALFKAARGPIVLLPGQPRVRAALADVDDVASVIIDLLEVKPSIKMVTIGGDRPEGYAWDEIIAVAARAAGGHPILVPIPSWAVKAAGAASEIFGRWRDTPPIFTLGKAREALHPDWSVSTAEQSVTVERLYTSLEDGFARAVAWYRSQGWL